MTVQRFHPVPFLTPATWLLLLLTGIALPALWSSPQIHHLFFLSAICAGLAMVSLESVLSSRIFHKGLETHILEGLGRGTAWMLLLLCGARLLDIWLRGHLSQILDGSGLSLLFGLEWGLLGLVPMVLLFSKKIRTSIPWLTFCQGLVLLGVILYRFDVVFLAQSNAGAPYFPSWIEIAVSIGLVAGGVLGYRLCVTYLPIFATAPDSPSP